MVDGKMIAEAAAVLRRGGLVALPTETVYGLGADAENELAVRRIFAAKGRPSSHPLIVHLANAQMAAGWVRELPPIARQLAEAFWPGPLTLVLARSERAADWITGGQGTVAVRVPAHPVMRAVLATFGGGIAAPSANRFGRVSPTSADHVRADFGDRLDLVLDDGPCAIGIESTIVDLASEAPGVLRPGAISRGELERVLRREVPERDSGIRVPGMMRSHYAPMAGVELVSANELHRRAEELVSQGRRVAVIAAEVGALPAGAAAFAMPAEVTGFGRQLYATFREVDRRGFDVALVVPPPDLGLGRAIRDRLSRAAAR